MPATSTKYEIRIGSEQMDSVAVYEMLLKSHWGQNRTLESVTKSIANSFCVGVFVDDQQVGIARVITDHAIFAYLLDVYVHEEHRGHGLARQMLQTVFDHPDLQNIQVWGLATHTAHGLYRKFGFEVMQQDRVQFYMLKKN